MQSNLADCDIVMKGGVTSGVVYPATIAALAARFRFRSIGGTSAGAIAAVVTAAAEYARTREGTPRGFTRLAQIPTDLRTGGLLLRLFTPQLAMAPLFRVLVAAFSAKPWWRKTPALLLTLFVYVVIPALAVLGIASLIAQQLVLWEHPGWIGFELAILALLYLLAVLSWLLPLNLYGLTRAEKLATWLADIVDEIAFGPGSAAAPLTFGKLWAPMHERAQVTAERVIDLQMMTTCISLGRPYRIPFDTNIFWFHPGDMRRYFPERIVQHMIDKARTSKNATAFAPLVPFPEAHDLPLVVAARMSLSFPVLISAVRLYAVDYNERDGADVTAFLPKPCWFSDGGLSSNFPVHFFDAPLPGRPTFGVDLRPFDERHVYDAKDESKNVSMVTSMQDDIVPESSFSKGAITSFLSAIVGTMQNWADSAQSRLPGYRDRIVSVHLRPSEGGLNLDMSPALLAALELRGRAAGEKLVQHFDPNDTSAASGWQIHRRIRYLTIMDMIQRFVRCYAVAWRATPSQGPSYPELVAGLDRAGPYERTMAFAQSAAPASEKLADLDSAWNVAKINFSDAAPRPNAELRVRPPV